MIPGRAVAPIMLSLCLLGCDRLSSFTLEEGESYCGNITLGSGFRQGFSPRLQLRVSFDYAQVEQGLSPGAVTSYDAGSEEGEQFLLDGAQLRVIPPLAHDPLSELEFGDGRERNLIYALSPADAAAESLLAFLSLRSDDSVEVRLVRAGSDSSEIPSKRALFGVFRLSRREGDCGF